MTSLAAFVSPHGYGHAARTCAVLLALRDRLPDLRFDLFTLVPEWFFRDSLGTSFTYHPLRSDVGLVQRSPVEEDLEATVAALDHYRPIPESRLATLAGTLEERQTALVLCDIAPLGIAAARHAGLPSVLVENFTWDWIYRGYEPRPAGLEDHAAGLAELFALADHHLQTRPVCAPVEGAFVTSPIARPRRRSRDEVRASLGIPADDPVVLLTMGGTRGRYDFLDRLRDHERLWTIAPGTQEEGRDRLGHLIPLPHHSEYFHPDLVGAADVVVGKLGYSTVAEAYHGGVAFAWIDRPAFRESPVLADFVARELESRRIEDAEFASGEWVDVALELASRPRKPRARVNGAEEAADYLAKLLDP